MGKEGRGAMACLHGLGWILSDALWRDGGGWAGPEIAGGGLGRVDGMGGVWFG